MFTVERPLRLGVYGESSRVKEKLEDIFGEE